MARNRGWGAYRAPKHGAQCRAHAAATADAAVEGTPVPATLDSVVIEGSRADLGRSDRNTNTNNSRKRTRRSAARAFKAQRVCAAFWDYDKL